MTLRRVPFSGAIAFVALAALALSACAPDRTLAINGGDSAVTMCADLALDGDVPVMFGMVVENTAQHPVTITGVELLSTHHIDVITLALAPSGRDGLGWGISDFAGIDDDPLLGTAWAARREPVGAEIAAGEREWLVVVAQHAGPDDVKSWAQGVRVEYDGAPWPRSTVGSVTIGFGPRATCSPDAVEEW